MDGTFIPKNNTSIYMEAEVPNNLIYTYNFSTNSWTFFKELTNPIVDAYSCTTFQAKNYSKYLSSNNNFNLETVIKTIMFSREVLALSRPWRSEYGFKMKYWKINPLTKNINFSSMNLKGLYFGAYPLHYFKYEWLTKYLCRISNHP